MQRTAIEHADMCIQEFQFIPMDRENNSKLRKLIQGAIQSCFKKCALQLSEKLTFGRYCESCRPCGLFFRAFAESQLSPPVHVPSLKISNDVPPVSPSSPSSAHYISPRPKANELRSAIEEPVKKSTMENYDVPVKRKSFLSMCCSSRSSVSAISRNSIHIDPGPSTAPRRQPASAGSPITATQPSTSSSSPVSPAISIPSDRWEVQSPVYFNLLTNEDAPLIRTDKFVSVFRNLIGDSSASFVLFNQNWEVISTSLLDDERTASILVAAKPPSPSAADGKASKIPTSELKIESLEEEDMSPPSPPAEDRKASDDLKSFWIVQVSKTVSAVFSVRGANVSTECIDRTTSREFLHFISFCFEDGLLPCSPIH